MNKSTASLNLQETSGFLGSLFSQVRLGWRLWNDSRVPGWVKLIPVAGLLYFLSPIDLIPDLMLPGLGEVDDVVVLLLALKTFLDLSPSSVVKEHLDQLLGRSVSSRPAGETPASYVDASYRVLDETQK